MNKKVKASIGIVFLCIILILIGYVFRLDRVDRFGMAEISWVDCVKISDKKYYSFNVNTQVEDSLIDKKIGKVKFNVSEMVKNSNYRFRNGDATFLKVGTEIYSLQSETNAVAVKIGEKYVLYKLM